MAAAAPYDPSRTFYTPEETLLFVEVVSPESAHRDRTVKLRKYAEAGIANYRDSSPRAAHHNAVHDHARPGRAGAGPPELSPAPPPPDGEPERHYTLKRNSTTSPSFMT
ncbi:hypothetical protein GCM10020358_75720 [Amorphoplanes nipponensis]|uniref:Uncharacterized protein n=1 Tax=Actinoplanes nipponensis TaxID=135950 RepID=A0A919JIP1_9ACTN|nr:Uma2 family endonuclease [Actinoplanes nipponensis]GIE50065.1 hypothetical protein Ani05nite_35990 [Actinoplanes nipponensis]